MWFRCLAPLARALESSSRLLLQNGVRVLPRNSPAISHSGHSLFSTLQTTSPARGPLLGNAKLQAIASQMTTTRNVTKFSLRSGKRKSNKIVLKKFYRLNWGIWIRTKAGRNKKLWRKHYDRKRRLRQHVFCNASQSMLLDKMTTAFWRRPKYFVDDPYEPYHTREEFPYTAKKPREYIPLDKVQS